jgi:hypothetical protein
VEHRHLLPDEFDLLVDGEEGFGVAPLATHVEACPACRNEVERRRRVVSALERAPHFSPSPLFAYRVMNQVQVFEPWYVSLGDSLRRMAPRSRPARIVAAATAGVVGVTMTAGALWIVTRLDVVLFLISAVSERARVAFAAFAGSALRSALGDSAASALLQNGATGIAIAVSAFLLTVVIAAVSLRAVTSPSNRTR